MDMSVGDYTTSLDREWSVPRGSSVCASLFAGMAGTAAGLNARSLYIGLVPLNSSRWNDVSGRCGGAHGAVSGTSCLAAGSLDL
jgi:hypothetical protein